MLRNLIFTVIFINGLSVNAQKIQYGFGGNLGTTISNPDRNSNIEAQIRPSLGIFAGVKFNLNSNFALISGIAINRHSIFIRHKDFNFPNLSNDNNRAYFGSTNSTFKIPINLAYKINEKENSFWEIQAGASYSYSMSTVLTSGSSFNGAYSGNDTLKYQVYSENNFSKKMGIEINLGINYYVKSNKRKGSFHRYSIGFDQSLFKAHDFRYSINIENSTTKVIHNVNEAVSYSYIKIEYGYFFGK